MPAARAIAHSNIALAKYWGKADLEKNLPAVPSLSMTLDGLTTETWVRFSPELKEDQVVLDGTPSTGRAALRVHRVLNQLRELAGSRCYAEVKTQNNFPTAAGLASSASGFAALVAAASSAIGLKLSLEEMSHLARQASASAARSIFGGYVELGLGENSARHIADATCLPARLLVAITAQGQKPIGSTEAMERTRKTSPYYEPWVQQSPHLFQELKAALLNSDLRRVGELMEQSALLMHSSMWGAAPAIIYFSPATLEVVHRVRQLRDQGTPAYFTMDAGPHVKVLTSPQGEAVARKALEELPGVHSVLSCGVGPGVRVETGASAPR